MNQPTFRLGGCGAFGHVLAYCRGSLLMMVEIPVSVGELVDKVTILRIKAQRIDAGRRANVEKELALLEATMARILPDAPEIAALVGELESVNAGLWDVEDGKRACERRQDFGAAFVALARAVYRENDRRAALKRRINVLTGSAIIEEKSYPSAAGSDHQQV